MGLSFASPQSTRDDVHLHARKFLVCICLQYVLLYLGNFSPSLIMGSLLGFAKGNSCVIEDAYHIHSSAVKSYTTFTGISSSQDNYLQQQHSQQLASQQPQVCLQENDTLLFSQKPALAGVALAAEDEEFTSKFTGHE